MTANVMHNVPIPAIRRTARDRNYPLTTMDVGDMFFAPHANKATMASYVSRRGKQLGRSFSVRECIGAYIDGRWHVGEFPAMVKSIPGLGVWRVE